MGISLKQTYNVCVHNLYAKRTITLPEFEDLPESATHKVETLIFVGSYVNALYFCIILIINFCKCRWGVVVLV